MIDESQHSAPVGVADILAGGGEMGALMRVHDWSTTALGPVESWSQSLRTAVSICINSKFPMVIWWGPELILLYNDAWRPILGATKHPQALGSPGQIIWPEIWDVIGPMFESVMTSGQATWSDDGLLLVNRYGYTEEAYFTWSYSAIRDETSAVGGVFTAVTETTERVISARRLKTLRDLAARSLEVRTVDVACRIAAETLAENLYDIPFALFYLRDDTGTQLKLVSTAGIQPGTEASPTVVALHDEALDARIFPLAQVAHSGVVTYVDDRDERWRSLPTGVWHEQPHSVLVVPVSAPGSGSPELLIAFAVSPRKTLDADYRNFFDLLAKQIAATFADARAYELERRRAEELAALNRAKTTFFSNTSHELRTPLTLMLGPLEEVLGLDDNTALGSVRAILDGTYRNSSRLLKLVNTLLDFSRIEAGRMEARYAPTNLAAFTADLAGVFRAAIEHAGLTLTVDCPPLAEPAYVDHAMWEKMVLNLLSNAFKFTFAGEIRVGLRQTGNCFELTVSDTGTGIPAAELPHLFERFHRIAGARGRSIEGSGIGLALVQELVQLHGGTVQVASTIDQGSTFTVAIPCGYAHLPTAHIDALPAHATTPAPGEAFVAEALQWQPNGSSDDQQPTIDDPLERARTVVGGRRAAGNGQAQARILLADDNADMRQYLQRILALKYQVVAVADGAAALIAAREQLPDLVLSDVMMPGLDGFGLIKALRADPHTQTISIMLLSARAGEEALIEGLEAGADDYMIKPFGARELLARVGSHVKLAQVRRAAAIQEQTLRAEVEAARAQLAAILGSISDAFVTVDHDWRYTYINDQAEVLLGRRRVELVGQQIWELFPEIVGSITYPRLQQVMAERVPVSFEDAHPTSGRWFENRAYPSEAGLSIFFTDISERKRAEAGLRFLADASTGLTAVLNLETSLQQVVELAVPSFADLCILYLLESDGSLGRIKVAHVDPGKADLVRKLQLDHPPDPQAAVGLGSVLRSQVTEFLPESSATFVAVAEPSLKQDQLMQTIGAKSSITVPLRMHNHSIGAIQFVISESTYRFTQEDRTLAEEVTRCCALAIENARLYVAEQAARARADAIAQQRSQLQAITAALATALTSAQVADVFIAQAVPVIGAAACWVVLLTDDQHMLEVIRTVGYPSQLVDHWQHIPIDTQAPVADAIRTGKAVWIESLDERRARYPTAAAADTTDFGTWVALPLTANGRILGGIGLSFQDFQPVSMEDRGFILSATQQCAQAFERAQLYEGEQQARAAAEAAVHVRDQFLAVAAHELKTPLTALLGYSQTLLRRVVRDASLGERDQRLLRQTGEQTLRLNRLVDTLLDVGRIETGRLSIEHQLLDMSALLQRIVAAMQPILEQHSLELAGTDQPLPISGDEMRLEQVIQNLLSNAVKYSPNGGPVRIALIEQGDMIQLAVSDEGMGIPEAAIPQLFQRFYRVAGTDTSHIAGMGIGLYVVKEIVSLHGGTISVDSTEGVGSTFTIRLSRRSGLAETDERA